MTDPETTLDTAVQNAPVETEDGDTSFELVVVDGPDAGKKVALTAPGVRVLVGKSHTCDLALGDPEVSRRHASFEATGARVRVVDVGSTNGTYAEEVSVNDAWLWGGEVVRIGRTTLRLELAGALTPPPRSERDTFGRLGGTSDVMRRLFVVLERLAASTLPVVVEGESGVGKETLAEAVHQEGPRADGPFVVLDALLASASDLSHVFDSAEGGTLYVDELADLDVDGQKALLALLERPVVDVRVIASTRVDIDKLVQSGAFREDLYYKVYNTRIELPPLRRRRGDAMFLARRAWTELGGKGGLPVDLAVQMERYGWPGNVRELLGAVSRRIALGSASEPLYRRDEAAPVAADAFERVLAMGLPLVRARDTVVAEFEKAYVARVLAENGGNVTRAAAVSGLARRYFQILRAKRAPRDRGA